MILHTINKSSSFEDLNKQLSDVITPTDSVVLIENGVYQTQTMSNSMAHWSNIAHQIFALESDMSARGLSLALKTCNVTCISYKEFVELSISHDKVISWY